MKKAQVTFEVTGGKTEVIATGIKGNIETTDITGTELEKDFVALLKKIIEHKQEKQILDAINIDNYIEQEDVDICLREGCDVIAQENYRLCPKHLREAHAEGFDDSNK